MALGHRPLVDGVRLGGLPLRLLEREDPVGGRRQGPAIGATGDGGGTAGLAVSYFNWSSRGAAAGASPASRATCSRRLRGPRRIRCGERRGAARRGIELSVVAAVDRDGELRARTAAASGSGQATRRRRGFAGDIATPAATSRASASWSDSTPSRPFRSRLTARWGRPSRIASDEAREDRARADLDERAGAGGVHRLDHLDEADRARDLAREGRRGARRALSRAAAARAFE